MTLRSYSLYLILPYLLWQDIKILKGNAVMGFPTLNAKKYVPITKVTPICYKTSLFNRLLTSSIAELINPQYWKYLVISLSTLI
jgi:hypothetical protein